MNERALRAILLIVATDFAGVAFGADHMPANLATGTKGRYAEVTPAQLDGAKKDFVLVNVHVPFVGEIPGTDAFIPYYETAARLREYPADKNTKIVVYCLTGRMSEIAARILAREGYTNVFDLTGGMAAWKAAGLAVFEMPAKRTKRR